jgi:superfamily II DNA/RNA helicase
MAGRLDPEGRVVRQSLSQSPAGEGVLASPRIRWGLVDMVVTTPAKFYQDIERFREDGLVPSSVVLDEADLLFNGPTQGNILDILKYIRPRESTRPATQFIFSSATMPGDGKHSVENLISLRFGTAERIQTTGFHSLPAGVESVEWLPESEGNWEKREHHLIKFLNSVHGKRVLIFLNSTTNVDALYNSLSEKKWPVVKYTKGARPDDINRFASGETPIVIATDIASRGIDWEGVDVIINFQMPTDVVTWIHRAGRCGRMGRNGGRIVSFYKDRETQLIEEIKSKIGGELSKLFSHKRSLNKRLKRERPTRPAAAESRRIEYSTDKTDTNLVGFIDIS